DAPQAILSGAAQADTFNVRPDQDVGDVLTPISVNGLAPSVLPGDTLNLDVTGLGIPTLTVGAQPRSGVWSFGTLAAAVSFQDIEAVTTPPATTFNLVLDMAVAGYQNGSPDTIVASLDPGSGELVLLVNGTDEKFRGNPAGVNSLTVIGSADDDVFR